MTLAKRQKKEENGKNMTSFTINDWSLWRKVIRKESSTEEESAQEIISVDLYAGANRRSLLDCNNKWDSPFKYTLEKEFISYHCSI